MGWSREREDDSRVNVTAGRLWQIILSWDKVAPPAQVIGFWETTWTNHDGETFSSPASSAARSAFPQARFLVLSGCLSMAANLATGVPPGFCLRFVFIYVVAFNLDDPLLSSALIVLVCLLSSSFALVHLVCFSSPSAAVQIITALFFLSGSCFFFQSLQGKPLFLKLSQLLSLAVRSLDKHQRGVESVIEKA